MKHNKLFLPILISLGLASGFAQAEETRIELRISIDDLRSQGAAPSTFSDWNEISARTNHTAWSPSAESVISKNAGERGVVSIDNETTNDVGDFAQTRTYLVTEERFEQLRVYDGDGKEVPDGEPVSHTRDITKTEQGVASSFNAPWSDTSAVTCTSWNAVGNSSRYLTPYTQVAEGQTRTCSKTQVRSNYITDSNNVVYPYTQSRTLQWEESSTQQGLMDNRSCQKLKDYYFNHKDQINAAQNGWSYNGWKRLDKNSSINYTTYCNDGWTMVTSQWENSAVPWTGANVGVGSQLDSLYIARTGWSMPSSYIPDHSNWAVGHGGTIDFAFSGRTYTTGDLAFDYNGYMVRRYSSGSYRWHNPRSFWTTEAQWKNTLTVENYTAVYGSSYDWAFSPNASCTASKGYALLGARFSSTYDLSWTIFVK